ncbi:MAG: tyrosine-type recombinase/integrase [Actinomycetota bacterium]|jgi:site-specific recombinase XerD|nr:tyrosine-type recombinase/integrase [Actinomycetota bacterium]
MSALAPSLQAWFTDRLSNQLHASPNTVAAYKDSWRLLLGYLQRRSGKQPSQLDVADLDPATISAFLDHLEAERHNCVRTRNARLAAIRSFFRFASLRHPEHAGMIAQVLAIPTKRTDHPEVSYLNTEEIAALVDAPDPQTWTGRRDRALIDLAVQTGLRVSELTGLRNSDIDLGAGAHVRCRGKGRRARCTPLTKQTVAVLRTWSREHQAGPDEPLFPSQRGGHLSRGGVAERVAKHAVTAAKTCPSIAAKKPTPHVLRHACAMELLRSGVDVATIALWLGHQSLDTTMRSYLHSDMSIKEKALARTAPPHTRPGRYHPPDRLLAFLHDL